MAQVKQSLLSVPYFVKAKSPEGLRRKMEANNIKHKKLYTYFDIQHVGGLWFAWYLEDGADFQRLQRDLDGNAQQLSGS